MAGVIRVTPEELVGMSNRYNGESSQVADQITRLDTMIRELEGAWEGKRAEHLVNNIIL